MRTVTYARDVQDFALAAKRNGELQDEDFLMAAYQSDCSDDKKMMTLS